MPFSQTVSLIFSLIRFKPRNLLELLIDEDSSPVQVHAVPGQAADFTATQASKQRDQINNLKTVPLDSFHKGPNRFIVQRLDFFPLHFRQFTGRCRIRVQIAYRNRLLQSLMENPMNALRSCTNRGESSMMRARYRRMNDAVMRVI